MAKEKAQDPNKQLNEISKSHNQGDPLAEDPADPPVNRGEETPDQRAARLAVERTQASVDKKKGVLDSHYAKRFDFKAGYYRDKPELLKVHQPFADIADMLAELPDTPFRTEALDTLLIAKDAALRAASPD